MKSVIIKAATNEADLQECLFIRREVFVKGMSIDEKIEIDALDSLEENCSVHFLLNLNGKSIATMRILYLGNNTIKLQRVAVLKEARDKGLGRQMIFFAEDYAKKNAINKAVLHSQKHAVGFYKKLGYKTVSDVFIEAGIEHVEMEKIL